MTHKLDSGPQPIIWPGLSIPGYLIQFGVGQAKFVGQRVVELFDAAIDVSNMWLREVVIVKRKCE